MFKLTTFAAVHPRELESALRGLHFRPVKGGYEWSIDGHIFRIQPFGPKGEHQEAYGYRIHFDGLIDGGLYLFEMSMAGFKPTIQAVEFDMIHPEKTQAVWISDFLRRPSLEPGGMRGIFSKGKVGIICLPDHSVNIQLRIKGKASKLPVLLREIESVRSELQPEDFNLFSYGEGVAG
ncbi:hypothetical protein D5E69_23045 (plasmid) [Rossellomorea marisflavi]|uniref:hypothetical protein n=1 Tax=Rossellomorea marisflavi TaxID=189381 RepID=UPI0013191CA5|nr:hypothetical protein [Rossellomorea marisflavi]QHA38713.1 hypothetical protein D5E69_23045 [Rossellomorea marisflavi]